MDKELINQIDGYVNQDNELIFNENKRIYQKYYNWLGINEIACKDEVEYKMVYLICAYFYFEQKSFIKDSDLFGIDNVTTKFIFDKACTYLCEINSEDVEKSSFSKETKELLIKKVFSVPTNNKLLITRGFCSNYYFKEKMTREYLYYLLTRPIQNDLEICATIKKLRSYEICNFTKKEKDKYCNLNKNYFFQEIIDGACIIYYDSLDFGPKSIEELEEFEVYNMLNRYAASGENVKCALDYHFYMVLLWLYQHNYSEFDYYEQQLEAYFERFKSNTAAFKKMTELLAIKKAMKEALREYKGYDISYEEMVLKKICCNANEQEIKECEDEVIKFGLDIRDIKKNNQNWYENIIQGEYFCRKVEKLYMSDYSLAVASWSICVEDMIYEKIYKNIENTYDNDLKIKIQRSIDSKHPFTLGTLPYWCTTGKSKDKILLDYDEKIISAICKELKYGNQEKFKKLIDGIDKLTDIRNKADHRIPVSIDLLEKCRELVFTSSKIIKILYEDF